MFNASEGKKGQLASKTQAFIVKISDFLPQHAGFPKSLL